MSAKRVVDVPRVMNAGEVSTMRGRRDKARYFCRRKGKGLAEVKRAFHSAIGRIALCADDGGGETSWPIVIMMPVERRQPSVVRRDVRIARSPRAKRPAQQLKFLTTTGRTSPGFRHRRPEVTGMCAVIGSVFRFSGYFYGHMRPSILSTSYVVLGRFRPRCFH